MSQTPGKALSAPLTSARISLGATGPAIPAHEHLRFQLDHALARDAVHAELDVVALQRGLGSRNLECLRLASAVEKEPGRGIRQTYLLRPDLGRRLDVVSRQLLQAYSEQIPSSEQDPSGPDAIFVLADGLSALAVERHALRLLEAVLALLQGEVWKLGPVCVITQGRVAVGDETGWLLGARLAVVLIGERPGLSSPDSLGAYLTWRPQPGRTDAERNCISNIRPEGLPYPAAAERLAFYMRESRRLGMTGVALKEGSRPASLDAG